MLHGLLHLAGYDHETDTGEMAAREEQLRRRFRLPTALIARTVAQPNSPGLMKDKSITRPQTARTPAGRKRAGRP